MSLDSTGDRLHSLPKGGSARIRPRNRHIQNHSTPSPQPEVLTTQVEEEIVDISVEEIHTPEVEEVVDKSTEGIAESIDASIPADTFDEEDEEEKPETTRTIPVRKVTRKIGWSSKLNLNKLTEIASDSFERIPDTWHKLKEFSTFNKGPKKKTIDTAIIPEKPLKDETGVGTKSNLRPLFFRYVLPLVVLFLILSGLTLSDTFNKSKIPEYSWEAYHNRTPYHYTGSYSRDFNDLNDVQLAAAVRIGIQPAETRLEVAQNPKLVPIDCLDVISVDTLTHSQALLVPKANQLLREIGAAFLARLSSDKLPLYHPILTSGTRTREDIGSLRRGNGNASENSTHMYGTTVDISWKRFEKVDPQDPRSLEADELKNLLAIVLKDLHDQGRCYIKHEARQACFHITVRP